MLFSKKTKPITLIIALLAVFLLTGCMPDNYTSEAADSMTKAHSDQVRAWFASNIPDAKITKLSAKDSGLDLVHFIGGYFELKGSEYPYAYDFDNDLMYTGRNYDKMLECAAEEIAAALALPVSRIRLDDPVVEADTLVENIPGDIEGTACIPLRGCIPENSTPEDFAKWVICDGNGDPVSDVRFKAYVDTIPAYDPAIFDVLKGIDKIDYVKAISIGTDDVYHVTYSRNKAESEHCYMQKLRDDLYAGYLYDSEETYDDDGALTGCTSEIDGQDPEPQFDFDPDGTLQLRIPDGMARPAVLTKGGKNYISVTGSSDTSVRKWSNGIRQENCSYLPGGPYDYYSIDCVFDSTGLMLYFYSSYMEEKGNYSIDL
ncbi:MAG: hypothetical protein K6B44_03620 [Lachnospiraceae bacterium]|nr:hypothetical protein [Lachnospiraceae bacterium]